MVGYRLSLYSIAESVFTVGGFPIGPIQNTRLKPLTHVASKRPILLGISLSQAGREGQLNYCNV